MPSQAGNERFSTRRFAAPIQASSNPSNGLTGLTGFDGFRPVQSSKFKVQGSFRLRRGYNVGFTRAGICRIFRRCNLVQLGAIYLGQLWAWFLRGAFCGCFVSLSLESQAFSVWFGCGLIRNHLGNQRLTWVCPGRL